MHYELRGIPDGDVIIHAGDFTNRGGIGEIASFAKWYGELPHSHKILIAGNHDLCMESDSYTGESILKDAGVDYLRDSGIQVGDVLIWGTPWQPYFHNWAFNVRTESEMNNYWSLIPDDADVVVCHGPCNDINDLAADGRHTGSTTLAKRISEVKPKLFVAGHIHESRGKIISGDTLHINASCVDIKLRVLESPWYVVDI